MHFFRISAAIVATFLLTQSATPLLAQMQPYGRLEGELSPIATCSDDHLTLLKDGKKRVTWDMTCQIRSGNTFAEGMVEVRDVQTDLDPLRNSTTLERSKPSAIRFTYRANLVADRSLSNCYALLSFITEGSVGTKLISIGGLSAGKPKSIEVKLPNQVDSVCSLHVFTSAQEVRSTQHRETYDVMAYYAEFLKNVRGLSAAELLKSEESYAHVLSADGRLLAALRERDAKRILIVYDLESMKLLSEIPVADVGYAVNGITWISDHEIAYIAAEDHRGYYYDDYNLHLFDTTTGKDRILLDKVYDIIASLPDHPEILVLFHGSGTHKFNVYTGKATDLNELEDGYFLFDRDGNDRIMTRYSGDKVTYFMRPTIGARWREIDEIVKQPGLRFNTRGAQLLDRTVDVHSVGPDGDTLYVSTRLEGSDRFELAAFSMSEGVIKRTIAKHPKYDLTTNDGGLARLLFAKKSPQLLGMIYAAQKPQVVWLDPRYAAVQKSIDTTFPDHVNLPIDWSKDGNTFIFFSTSEKDPGTYYVFKAAESRLIPLLELGERLKGKTLAKTEAIEFTARDGQKIPAYVTRPSTPGEGPAPLIVSIHGGPMVRDNWRFDASNQFFASRGYIVLQVNYRGSSGYGAAFQSAGLKVRLDTVVLDDLADGVQYLIDQKEVDPTRIAVMGGSFGGWATYMSLIKYPKLYRAGIAIAAVSNWRKFIRDDHWQFDNRIAFTFWKSLLGRENFAADEKHIDPFLRAAEIKQPVFIVHGEQDTVVSPQEAKMMLDALKKDNPNIQSRSFPRSSHTYWPYEDRVVMLNESARFLETYLGKSKTEKQPAATP